MSELGFGTGIVKTRIPFHSSVVRGLFTILPIISSFEFSSFKS